MIPTIYKSKLSHLMSYPTSAGKLSSALAGVPQINDLSISFFASYQDPSKLANPCQILHIGYSYQQVSLTSSNEFIAQGYYEAKWHIMVYPVPRTRVSIVKSKLAEEGLQKVREWLHLHKDATGQYGNCWLHLFYDVDANLLTYEEQDKLLG
ncbi:hypothetical protein NIES267_02220 [Calothrix parasitica NIES-267]|uniref:Uncharacterized protein n=1 Tax=Calothrix parasitica NIES-267 TaxID=1973488 RepID=A0A1Z4LHQ3_9CYAN|nr:hypothetical protein NIES267_02220 [Calothrix parasitica NIES-267]